MPRDDRTPLVEFLVPEHADGADEDLAEPVGFPRLRRARLPLAVAGAVVVLAVAVLNVVNGPSGSPSAAPATVTVSPSSPSPSAPEPSRTGASLRFDPGRLVTLHVPPGRRSVLVPDVTCPAAASCNAQFTTPKRLVAAIRRHLPEARHLRTVTMTFHEDVPGSQLLSRRIIGRVGVARLTIDIRPAGRNDRTGWNAAENAAQTIVTAAHHDNGRLVSARLAAPPGYEVSIYAVGHLVGDKGLTGLR